MKTRRLLGALLTTALVVCLLMERASAIPGTHAHPSIANFEGMVMDLREGWGEATACSTDGETTTCYRTEKAMNAALERKAADQRMTCTPELRLYRDVSFGGPVLHLSTQGLYINLSTWGFDNMTSSYRVGACDSTFYDGAFGGLPSYPGATWAGVSSSSMVSGWNDRISSVRIA